MIYISSQKEFTTKEVAKLLMDYPDTFRTDKVQFSCSNFKKVFEYDKSKDEFILLNES